MTDHTEQERIARVYRQWNEGRALPRYDWHRPEVLQQVAARERTFAAMFQKTVGLDMAALHVLDVGCGSGNFLRLLLEWGADPAKLTGTELLPERLDGARHKTLPGVHWHLGGLDGVPAGSFDLASAQTVFSSILDDATRQALAADMWRTLRPGGWCMVFDFRYDNPRNRNVRRVTPAELRRLWPASKHYCSTLLLAPPLARRLSGAPYILSDMLAALLPPLRSHFVFMAQKDKEPA